MKNKFSTIFTFTLTTVLFSSCLDNDKIANSDKIFKEEIIAYNDIINDIVDTSFYYKELKEHNDKIAIFFLFDTLTTFDNKGEDDIPSDTRYLRATFQNRQFSSEQINGIKKYKFVNSTKYPNHTIVNGALHVLPHDSLKLRQGEWFTGKWMTLSRICFNSDLTKGHLFYRVWCGDLCSWGDGLDIEKINGKWKTSKRYQGPVS